MEYRVDSARHVPAVLPRLYQAYRHRLPPCKQVFAPPKLPPALLAAPGLACFQDNEPAAVLLWHEHTGCSSVISADFYAESPDATHESIQLLLEQCLSRTSLADVFEIALWISPQAKIHRVLPGFGFQAMSRQLLALKQRIFVPLESEDIDLIPLTQYRLTPARMQQLAEVLYHAYAGTADGDFYEQFRTPNHALEYLSQIIDAPHWDYRNSWIACSLKTHRLAGLAFCYDWARSNSFYLEQLAVHPQFQAQGLGRALFSCISDALAPGGRDQLLFTVSQANTRALQLYRVMGAIQLDTETEYVHRRSHTPAEQLVSHVLSSHGSMDAR